MMRSKSIRNTYKVLSLETVHVCHIICGLNLATERDTTTITIPKDAQGSPDDHVQKYVGAQGGFLLR